MNAIRPYEDPCYDATLHSENEKRGPALGCYSISRKIILQ